MTDPPLPMCFIAMPFGRKAPPGRDEREINFDDVWQVFERAITAADLAPVRADVQPGGGFVHRQMYEGLMFAEYVVADLTFANANVTYEVGVRHGLSDRPTVLVGARGFLEELPFDFAPLRVLSYELEDDGTLSSDHASQLEEQLREQLTSHRRGTLRVDNPIAQVTSQSVGRLEHDKTDVFLERKEYATEVEQRIKEALMGSDADASVTTLESIADQLLDGSEVVAQLHSALIAIYLGYRRHKAWDAMVQMFPRLPRELQVTAVTQEQLALALNRLAEARDKAAQRLRQQEDEDGAKAEADEADVLRSRALDAADVPDELVTAETWGIRGRIYKGRYAAETAAGRTLRAASALAKAIEAYESGVKADIRDYYPGVNAVTLRLTRSSPEDIEALRDLVPVVRMAVEVAPPPRSVDERYWRAATKMELASAAKDFAAARAHLVEMLGLDVDSWMYETSADNLRIHEAAFGDDPAARQAVPELIAELA